MNDAVRALVYLQATSLAGNVRQRVRRLRQPRYLVGGIVGLAYLYFFLLRRMVATSSHPPDFSRFPPAYLDAFALVAAVGLLLALAYAWVMPSDRAVLRFSEAETDFLFAGPVSRTGLIHFSLLRSQLAVFASSFLIALLFRRGALAGTHPLQYATALWLLMATVRLHYLGASFTRERLLGIGIGMVARVAVVAAVLGACAVAVALWTRTLGPLPASGEPAAIAGYVGNALGHGPAAVVLAPLRWLLAPLFAQQERGFAFALLPALALFALHYLWVVKAQVSFEEASSAAARKRAETRAVVRAGRGRLRTGRARAHGDAFPLRPTGFAPIAFLWSGLTGAGPLWRPRTAALAAFAIVAATQWLGGMAQYRMALDVVALVCLGLAGAATLIGPMVAQQRLHELPRALDVLRAYPLPGWGLALGQLLTPVAMLASVQGLLLLTAASAGLGTASAPAWLHPGTVAALAVAALALLPVVDALLMCVPFSFVLLFPGWAATGPGRQAGVEVVGQRVVFAGAYLLVLAVALVPAAVVAALAFFPLRMFAPLPVAILAAALAAAGVVGLVVTGWVRWLGTRIQCFDVSTELA